MISMFQNITPYTKNGYNYFCQLKVKLNLKNKFNGCSLFKKPIKMQQERRNIECVTPVSVQWRPHLVSRPGYPGSPAAYLHGVRSTELHLRQVPGSVPRTAHLPQFLIQARRVPSVEGEDVVIVLLELVIEGQAAGHGGRGHRGDELCHLLEVLDVNRVHVHVVPWKTQANPG